MKKSLLILAFILFGISRIIAQVPNSSFENWHSDSLGRMEPDGWVNSDSIYSIATVIQDAGYTGTYSIKYTSVYDTSAGYYQGGQTDLYHQVFNGAARPTSLNGYWKFYNPSASDIFFMEIWLYDASNTQIGHGGINTPISGNIPAWTSFTIPLNYTSSNALANFSVDIFLGNFGSNPATTANLDDLNFDTNTGLNEIGSNEESISLTTIPGISNQYYLSNIPSTGSIDKVNIIDLTGKVIKKFDINELSPENKILLDMTSFRAGIYICQVISPTEKKSLRIMVY